MPAAQPTVLISGAGQLGIRYLQGLVRCGVSICILVHDVSREALTRAQRGWNEVRGTGASHEVSFHETLEFLPRQLDIAIVATTADVRAQVTREIARRSDVRYWVLEKVLAQNEVGLDELQWHVRHSARAWVNTPRRMMVWHQQIRSHLVRGRLTLNVKGGQWGLACNAIHFLDLLAWWSGEKLAELSTDRLSPAWAQSKRRGFMEVFGTLEARYSGGSRALLSSDETARPLSMEVDDPGGSWLIDEAQGVARRADGFAITGRLPYQSEMSGELAESILKAGNCDLPLLADSTSTHRIFIRSMHDHWKRAGNPAAGFVPIT